MSLSIRFSITLSAANLEPTDLTAGTESPGQQLVSLLDSAVSSGTFATSVSDEAAKRGETVAVKATVLESICLICDTGQVIINNIQVSESVYMGIVVLLLLVAVLLFFGELAILIGFNTLRFCQTGEPPSSDSKQPSCRTLTRCQFSWGHYKAPTDTSKISKEEWVTQYGSDAGFDLYDAGGGIASGRSPRTPYNLLSVCLFVCLFGTNTCLFVWLCRRFKKRHGCQTIARIWNAIWVKTIITMLQLNCFVAAWYWTYLSKPLKRPRTKQLKSPLTEMGPLDPIPRCLLEIKEVAVPVIFLMQSAAAQLQRCFRPLTPLACLFNWSTLVIDVRCCMYLIRCCF